ncbi:porin OmpA, partial [Aeromonas veronii]
MKKSLITLLVTGLLAANAQAAGQDNTWYGGAKLGWSNFYGIDESNALTLGNETNDALGAGVFGGYQINKNLGLELGYDYLGNYKYDATTAAGAFSDEVKAQLAQLTLKLGFPVTDNLDLYGRVGGGYGWADTKSDVYKDDSRFVMVGALGAEYAFNLDWAARLEYQYTTPYGSRDDTGLRMDNGLLSLAAVYRFGQVAPVAPAPAPEPAPAPVMVEKQFTLSSDVLFDFNKATLKP